MTRLTVGGVSISVEAPAAVRTALEQRFAAFAGGSGSPDLVLTVAAGDQFSPEFHLERSEPALRILAHRDGGRVRLEGAARGWFDPGSGRGGLEAAAHLGEVDGLLRLALALTLPRRGSLLFHGAAVETARGAVALVGASGAGKSTAAAALGGALSDELVVVRPRSWGSEVEGTPYWHGRPGARPLRALGCLERGGSRRSRLAGAAALRAIAPHVVRYLPDVESDRAAFALLGELCAHVPVERLACPEGSAFVPFLRSALDQAEAAP